ncbi:MAG: hypothetical protein NT137_01070 [Methanomassiliicoccales archaeon]|nr:hypothetical protein [Methanomassiliicoccales archaeon]
MSLAAFRIRVGSIPADKFEPTTRVSGRSVFSRRVTQGTFKMHASSWMPSESVRIKRAEDCSCRKSR